MFEKNEFYIGIWYKKSWIWMKDCDFIYSREKEFVGMSSEFFHSLHYFKPFLTNVLIFYTPRKHQKTFGFLVFFSGGMK